jgi:hypothetical protein
MHLLHPARTRQAGHARRSSRNPDTKGDQNEGDEPHEALAALAILAEKVVPRGEQVAGAIGLVLVVAGAVLAFAPTGFPGLVEPM